MSRVARRRLAALMAVVLLAACTSDDDPGARATTAPEATTPPLAGESTVASTSPPTSTDRSTPPPTTARRRPSSRTDPPSTDAPSTDPPSPPPPPDGGALGCVARLPTNVLAGQLVWPAVYGDQLDAQAQTFADWGVGGALLMTWPDGATPGRLRSFASTPSIPLLVGTDEEGGDVQRFRRLGAIPSQADVAETMSVEEAEQMVADHARLLADAGVDVVFGPVADVGPADGSTGPMEDRVFSADPAVVADYTSAYVRAWQDAGLLPVLKHFPGHGSASADTHTASAETPPLDELVRRDLAPYQGLRREDVGVMVGHLDVPGLTEDGGGPASLSPAAITNLLRNQLGFRQQLVFTDALDMDAAANRAPLAEAAERAVAAGADVVLFTDASATPDVIAGLVDAVDTGHLPPGRLHQAVLHVLDAKDVDPCDLDRAGLAGHVPAPG